MDKVGCDMICKNHSARSDRDQFRICPTRLSKDELENVYFALVENNLELKKTINRQEDRIKMLSTKIQRLSTVQKIFKPDGKRECCLNTRAVVNRQKDLIADMKHANERMADRIRKLNMRLCSAKQFCKSATPRCLRCSSATSPYLIKHSPHSQKHQSLSTLKLGLSCHNLSRSSLSTKYTQTEVLESKVEDKDSCENNKCSTIMDELKQKIINLEEELFHTKEQYTIQTNELQLELEHFRNENVRVRSERVAIEHDLAQLHQKNGILTTSLRSAEGLNNELKTHLSIEKRKILEMETRLKAATMSNQVTRSIEETLTSIQESSRTNNLDLTPRSTIDSHTQYTYTELSPNMNVCDVSKISKSTDDSGYGDTRNNGNMIDDQALNKIIEELTNRIIMLQTQVDALTISPPEIEKIVDHSFPKKDLSDVKIELISPIPKPAQRMSLKSKSEYLEISQPIFDNSDLINSNKAIKVSSPKKDKHSSIQVPAKNIAKMATVTKKINVKSNDNVKTNENNCDVDEMLIRELDDGNIEKAFKTSSASDDGTYNVSEKQQLKEETERTKVCGIDKLLTNPKDERNGNSISGKWNTNLAKIATVKEIKNKDGKPKKTKGTSKEICSNGDDDRKEELKTITSDDKTYNIPEKDVNVDGNIQTGIRKKALLKRLKTKSVIEKPEVKEKPKKITKQKTLARSDAVGIRKPGSHEEATYTLEHGKTSRGSSPENTDNEISSMTDLSEDREPKSPHRCVLSPGERKYSNTETESVQLTTDTTNYSLSEGEIPTAIMRRRSRGDNSRPENGPKEAPKMEDTLQAISEEMTRCKRLLFSQRSRDNITPAIV